MSQAKTVRYLSSYVRWAVAAAGLIWVVASRAQSTAPSDTKVWSLESFMLEVEEKNNNVIAAKLQKEAAELRRRQGDFAELSPFLQAEAVYFNDKQETVSPAVQGTETKAKLYSLGLSKNFSTGTSLSLQWGQTQGEVLGTFVPAPASWESKYTLGLTQSLWKNAFGRGTRLRQRREDAQTKMALLQALLQEKQARIEAEAAYWEFALQKLDQKEKADALKRAEKIREWTSRRLRNGIGDRADLLQVESLLAQRRLAQIGSGDSFETAKKNVADALQADPSLAWDVEEKLLLEPRRIETQGSMPFSMGVWLQNLASEVGSTVSEEAADALSPDLQLQEALGANARDIQNGTSASDALARETPFYRVGLKLAMSLDFGLRSRIKEAARADAKAAKLRSDKAKSDAAASWNELLRRHAELGARFDALQKLARAQEAQLQREQDRLAVGRSTTFQVIPFEQAVADSRLALLQLSAQQRKLEAQSTLYINQEALEAL